MKQTVLRKSANRFARIKRRNTLWLAEQEGKNNRELHSLIAQRKARIDTAMEDMANGFPPAQRAFVRIQLANVDYEKLSSAQFKRATTRIMDEAVRRMIHTNQISLKGISHSAWMTGKLSGAYMDWKDAIRLVEKMRVHRSKGTLGFLRKMSATPRARQRLARRK